MFSDQIRSYDKIRSPPPSYLIQNPSKDITGSDSLTMLEDGDQTSLRSLYDTAEGLRKEIEESHDYQSDAYQVKLRFTTTTYEKCKQLVDQISLFSSNEGLEDVSSSEIR